MEKAYIIIDAVRDVYNPGDITNTLTAGELKRILDDFDDDTPIILSHDNGYTFGALTYGRVEEQWLEVDA